MKSDKHFCKYYEAINILFKTGLRISEFAGLTKDDINLKNRVIVIDHQLMKMEFRNMPLLKQRLKVATEKSPCLMRNECFKRILENRENPKIEPIINGKSGFLNRIYDK